MGPPYFEAVLGPLLTPAVFMMGIGPLARWQRAPLPELKPLLLWCLAASVVAAALAWGLGRHGPAMGWGVLLGTWAILTAARAMWQRQRWQGARAWGTLVAHLGVGVFVLALTVLRTTSVEKELAMRIGQTEPVGPYQIRLDALTPFEAGNHAGIRATVSVWKDGIAVDTLHPESRNYRTQDMTVATPDIDTGLWRDVYVAMGQRAGPAAWALRLQVKPMMVWVWIGFLMTCIGGVVAAGRSRPQAMAARQEEAASALPLLPPDAVMYKEGGP